LPIDYAPMRNLFPVVVFRLMLIVGVALPIAGCSGGDDDVVPPPSSPRAATEQLIVGPMAEVIGLGPLAASCPEMNQASVGDVFQCSAVAEGDGQPAIAVAAEILPTGQVDLATTNVITAEAMDGTTSIVLPSEQTMVCGLWDPATESIFDVTLNVTDIEQRRFSLVVADLPRR